MTVGSLARGEDGLEGAKRDVDAVEGTLLVDADDDFDEVADSVERLRDELA